MNRGLAAGALLALIVIAWAAGPVRAGAGDAAARFEQGNQSYAELRYADALEAYRAVLASGHVSAELFHNMGNAALQSGESGWAVFYYEQARRRAPLNPDIAANLDLARRSASGGETAASRSILLDGFARGMDLVSPGDVAHGILLLAWLGSGAILFDWWRPGSRRRTLWIRWAVIGGACAGALLAGLEAAQQSLAPEAMVIEAGPAHSEPDEGSTVEFRLAAGSPVDLGRKQGQWREIKVSESLRGWMPETAIAEFAQPR